MILHSVNSSKDEKGKFFGNLDIGIEEDKKEVEYSQRILSLDHDVSIVSKSVVTVLAKHGDDIIRMITESNPEDMIKGDLELFKEYLKVIHAN